MEPLHETVMTGDVLWLECVSKDLRYPREPVEPSAPAPDGKDAAGGEEPQRRPAMIEAWARNQFGKDLPEFLAPPPRHPQCDEWREAEMPDLRPSRRGPAAGDPIGSA